jgi:effector-binding domain-containing protein
MDHPVNFQSAPVCTLAVADFHIKFDEMQKMGEYISRAFGTVATQLSGNGNETSGPAIACYRQTSDGFDVSAGFPVDASFHPSDSIRQIEVGGCEVAHTTHIGGYDTLPVAYEDLRIGADKRGKPLSHGGIMWEEYWSDPAAPPEKTRTEIFWPVES